MSFDRTQIANFLPASDFGLELTEPQMIAVEQDRGNLELVDAMFRVADTAKGNLSGLEIPELAGFGSEVGGGRRQQTKR